MAYTLRSISQVGTSEPFELQVSRGQIPGHSALHKFGANFDIDAGTIPETVWSAGGLYPWSSLATAQSLYVLSDDAADTEEVEIQGLDASYNAITETVTLTGTVAVQTDALFLRVYRMLYNHGGTNEGTITARTVSGTGTVVAQIDEVLAQTLMAVYTVPAGYTAYIGNIDASVQKNKDAQVQLFVRAVPTQSFRIKHMAEVYESQYRYEFHYPLRVDEKSDIDVRTADVEANNTRVTSNFDILLVKNEGPL